MKTFALLFAFVPVFFAYIPGGDIKDAPVLETLLLIWIGVEIVCFTAKHHADESERRIINGYVLDQAKAFYAGKTSAFTVSCAAMDLFETRGAA